MKRICVIGSINMDLVAVAPRFPSPGETITGTSFGTYPGGKGANQAVAAAKLGGNVAMVGKVGDDVFADRYLSVFRALNVDVGSIDRVADESTGIAMIEVDNTGENHIIIVAGANGRVNEQYIDQHARLISSCDIFLLQLEIPLGTVVHAARLLASLGKIIILDPAPAADLPRELYRYITYITPNEHEAKILTGVEVTSADSAASAGRILADRGVAHPIIKAGRAGAYLMETANDGGRHVAELVPGYEVDAVDTTAAGDSFNGGLAVAISRGFPLRDAVQYANAVGALSTTAKGAQSGMPTDGAVHDLMARAEGALLSD